MKNLKKLYLYNSIFRFMVSYAGVLLIPLLVCLLSYQFAFNTVEEGIKENNLSMLKRSKNLIDGQLITISSLMMQSADNPKIISFSNKEIGKHNEFYTEASDVISEMSYIFKYSNTDILENIYLYVDKTDYIVTRYDLYKTHLYYQMVLREEMSYEEWINQLEDQQVYRHYLVTEEKIKCIQKLPIGINKPIQGAVVCDISKKKLASHFSDLQIAEGASLFIIDKEGQLLLELSENNMQIPTILKENSKKEVFEQKIEGVKSTIFNLESKDTGWRYILVLPEEVTMHKLTNLKLIITLLFILAVISGVIIAYYMANRSGKPIEEVKKQLIDMDDEIKVDEIVSTSSLSGTLTKILSQKQVLVTELENQKPYLESVLFQKLIKGEFANLKEITYICQKTQVDLEAEAYWVINCRFFGNNDMFNLDEQTLEDVSLLKLILKEMIQDTISEKMFFYDLDHLTITMIVPKIQMSLEEIKEGIHKLTEQMLEEYEVTPYWGISDECNNLLQLWRAFEQSKLALKSGIEEGESNLIEYSEHIQDETTYYYTQVVEKQLMSYIKEGNNEGIKKLLEIVYMENFESRHLSEDTIDKLYSEIKGTILKLTKQDDTQFYINSIGRYMISKELPDIKKCFSKMTELCIGISGTFSQEKKVQQTKLIHRIMNYINEEYSNANLGLGMIATNFNISEGYVSSLFKEQAKVNFTEYVETQRINKACELLKTTDLSINDIGEKVGYNSVQSFRRAFKRVHGFNPSELRKK